jgi:hypothetical protein
MDKVNVATPRKELKVRTVFKENLISNICRLISAAIEAKKD